MMSTHWGVFIQIAYFVCSLIVVLALVLFLSVLALIVFRDSLEACCCRRGQTLIDRRRRRREIEGQLNPTFNEQERSSRRLPDPRPFSSMEAVETPPTYEEAIKQELFRFPFRPTPADAQRSELLNEATTSHPATIPPANPFVAGATASNVHHQSPPSDTNLSLPSTSSQSPPRRRGTTVTTIASQLSTISEEDCSGEWPVTVVIDCIGVQSARLMENCDTSISLEDGGELGTHSKC